MIPMGNMPGFGAKIQYTAWNPLDKGSQCTLSNGNLTASAPSNVDGSCRSVVSKSTGKWYWELTINTALGCYPAIADATASLATYLGADTHGWCYVEGDGTKIHNAVAQLYGAAFTTNDIIGVMLDATSGTVEFLKNNASQGVITLTGLSAPYYAGFGNGSGVATGTFTANFGGSAFAYAVPAGYNPGLYS